MKISDALDAFLDGLPFSPDPFQVEALEAFAAGDSVVVTAPTGAGKTLVAQGAVELTLQADKRSFYTTPIKALSNQKYAEFRAIHGDERVGLLTGDNVINGDAPIVVMTTEVLRNMIYADSPALRSLGCVVLDEVHYLQDRYRGSVWEEVIIHLSRDVPIVALSATIANPGEFTGWIEERRGATTLIVERHRPVPLESLFMVYDRHHGTHVLAPIAAKDRPNPQIVKLLRKGRGRFRRFATPRRVEVVEELLSAGLLPAIYFIFSRAGCEQAATTVAGAGLDLTSPDERAAIRSIVDQRIAHIDMADLAVLGFDGWLSQLERGVAAHHAGMVPAFKEAVEDVFAAGLVKVVFATETLALGINMPARSVVLESLSRFTGDAHEMLQPGDYTQLTGRAGRRGIDTSGSAIVLYSGHVPFEKVADIAGAGTHVLQSSFQPTYNMAVNLVANYERERAFELLRASFASYRREQQRRGLEERIVDRERALGEFRERAECERGDIWAFLAETPKPRQLMPLTGNLQPGDVVQFKPGGERAVVLVRGWGGRSPRVLLLTENAEVRQVRPNDLPATLVVLGTLELPEPFAPREAGFQERVAASLRVWEGEGPGIPVVAADGRADPVAQCPQLQEHLGWARRAQRAEAELDRLRRRVTRRRDDLVSQFTAVLDLLEEWGYLDGWELTERGTRLRWVYNELDLLLAEAITRGHLQGLDAPQLAALISIFTFEPRRLDVAGSWPDPELAARGEAIDLLWQDLSEAEARHHLAPTRRPEPGFADLAYRWASGSDLEELFADDDFAAGDFVRNCRQLLDLLRQLRDAFPTLAETAAEAVRDVDRGIVAAGGRV